MDPFRFSSKIDDNAWSWPPDPNQMNAPPKPQENQDHQAPPTETEDEAGNWTVDSADVFVRSGPNGMDRFAPWTGSRTVVTEDKQAKPTVEEE